MKFLKLFVFVFLVSSCQKEIAQVEKIQLFFDKENTKIKEEGTVFKVGRLKTGFWKIYFENGNLMSSGDYDGEKQTGEWKFYHETGELLSKGKMVDGLKDGYWEQYFENGRIASKGNYQNGL